eukprot:13686181-Alexandrium_andersonii.AAC.1
MPHGRRRGPSRRGGRPPGAATHRPRTCGAVRYSQPLARQVPGQSAPAGHGPTEGSPPPLSRPPCCRAANAARLHGLRGYTCSTP